MTQYIRLNRLKEEFVDKYKEFDIINEEDLVGFYDFNGNWITPQLNLVKFSRSIPIVKYMRDHSKFSYKDRILINKGVIQDLLDRTKFSQELLDQYELEELNSEESQNILDVLGIEGIPLDKLDFWTLGDLDIINYELKSLLNLNLDKENTIMTYTIEFKSF